MNLLRSFVSPAYRYVLINTLVSVVLFGRNVLFMDTLGLSDLGQLAIMQTIVMLVGFSQAGLINGAYLMYADKNRFTNQKIVNILCVFFILIVLVFLMTVALAGAKLSTSLVATNTLIIGLGAGVATLASTWLNNALIAEGALAKSNLINMLAITVSLAAAFLSVNLGLVAALLSILLQPVCIALGALLVDKRLRPNKVEVDRKVLYRIFSLGIMQFLGGVTTLLSYQLERWSIVFFLGDEALGKFYLVIMYMAFFILIPASLLNLYFPRASRSVLNGDLSKFNQVLKRHLRDLTIYCLLAVASTLLFLPLIIESYFPKFVSSIHLIFLLLPVMVIFVFRDVVTLVLFATKNTRPILKSGLVLICVYIFLIAGCETIGIFNLEHLIWSRGIAVLISTIYLFYIRIKILNCLKHKFLSTGLS